MSFYVPTELSSLEHAFGACPFYFYAGSTVDTEMKANEHAFSSTPTIVFVYVESGTVERRIFIIG